MDNTEVNPPSDEADSTPSIADGPEIELKVKASRFLARAFAASDEEAARAVLSTIRRRYHDARHHCWALRLQPWKRCTR